MIYAIIFGFLLGFGLGMFVMHDIKTPSAKKPKKRKISKTLPVQHLPSQYLQAPPQQQQYYYPQQPPQNGVVHQNYRR